MKKLYIGMMLLVGVIYANQLKSQVVNKVLDEIPDVYSYTYRINDYQDPGRVFDQRSDRDIKGNGVNGGDNQDWIILPLHPSSDLFVIASYLDGGIIDRRATGSNADFIYSNTEFNKGENQMWFLNKQTTNKYFIYSKIVDKVLDRKLSGSKVDYIYTQTRNGGTNQQMGFTRCRSLGNNSDKSYGIVNDVNNLSLPVRPTSINDTRVEGAKSTELLISKSVVPFILVQDDRYTHSQKARWTPFYRIERYAYYRLMSRVIRAAGDSWERIITYKYGLTNSDNIVLEQTLNVKYSTETGFNASIGILGLNVKNNFDVNLGYRVTQSSTITGTFEKTGTIKYTHSGECDILIQRWARCEEIRVYRMNENEPFRRFEIVYSKNDGGDGDGIDYSYPSSGVSKSYFSSYENIRFSGPSTLNPVSTTSGPSSDPWIELDFGKLVSAQTYTVIMPPSPNGVPHINWELQAFYPILGWTTIAHNYWSGESRQVMTLPNQVTASRFRLCAWHEMSFGGSIRIPVSGFEIAGTLLVPGPRILLSDLPILPLTKSMSISQEVTLNNITEIDIYPNPSKGTISYKAIRGQEESIEKNKLADIIIYSAGGKMVKHLKNCTSETSYNLDLPRGIYLVVVKIEGVDTCKKLIIE